MDCSAAPILVLFPPPAVCSRFFLGNFCPCASSIAIFFSPPVFLLLTTFPLLFSPSPPFPLRPVRHSLSTSSFFFFPTFSSSALTLFLWDCTQEMTHIPALELQVPHRMPPLKRNATKDRVKKVPICSRTWYYVVAKSEWRCECVHSMPVDASRHTYTCWRMPKSRIQPLSGISWRGCWRPNLQHHVL